MDNFIVSARKYRPSTFATVVGQKALTQTLKNAISSGHLAHAYLFCGPRGVGKTTCARIFAKTINCLNPTADHEACNECESCKSFNEGRSMNIHELDAASNNSVDDIRSLIDQVRIPPQMGRYSVYIIDEVHMLSQAAFNAFLKTLEEPPSYAIFILATTEKHKILPTILSRCQVYDFSRITVQDTVDHLASIAEKEGVQIEAEALNAIAQKADGGMRDALSIFDQLVSYCGTNITQQNALDSLNMMGIDYYFRLTDCFINNKVTDALLILNEILSKGFDGGHFITGLAQHLRDVLVSSDPQTTQLLEASELTRQRYCELAKTTNAPFLFQALRVANDADIAYRTSKNKRLCIELMLIRLCQITDAPVGAAQQVLRPVSLGNEPTAPKTAPAQPAAPVQPVRPARPAEQPQTAPHPLPKQGIGLLQSLKQISEQTQQAAAGNAQAAQATQTSTQQTFECRDVNETDLVGYWSGFSTTIHNSRLRSILLNTDPQLEGTVIRVAIDNKFAMEEVKTVQDQLLNYLRNNLHNHQLTLDIYEMKSDATNRAYTSADQRRLMQSINSEFEHFIQALNLEIV